MTGVGMIAGMLPLALGVTGDAALQGQMAIAVIGGLVTSTALALVMVPAGFTVMDDLERWLGRRLFPQFGGKQPAGAAPPTAAAAPVALRPSPAPPAQPA